MREVVRHKVEGLNEALRIEAIEEPGNSDACHLYAITDTNAKADDDDGTVPVLCYVQFQDGPIGEAGVNGISVESLVAIVEDRLLTLQSGPLSCSATAIALAKLQEAMLWLQRRTRERVARGVEGTGVA